MSQTDRIDIDSSLTPYQEYDNRPTGPNTRGRKLNVTISDFSANTSQNLPVSKRKSQSSVNIKQQSSSTLNTEQIPQNSAVLTQISTDPSGYGNFSRSALEDHQLTILKHVDEKLNIFFDRISRKLDETIDRLYAGCSGNHEELIHMNEQLTENIDTKLKKLDEAVSRFVDIARHDEFIKAHETLINNFRELKQGVEIIKNDSAEERYVGKYVSTNDRQIVGHGNRMGVTECSSSQLAALSPAFPAGAGQSVVNPKPITPERIRSSVPLDREFNAFPAGAGQSVVNPKPIAPERIRSGVPLGREFNAFPTDKGQSVVNPETIAPERIPKGSYAEAVKRRSLNKNDMNDLEYRKPKKRAVIRGAGDSDDILVAVKPSRFIHLFSLRPSTTEEQVLSYMIKKKPEIDECVTVEKMVTRGKHASFKITISATEFDTWMKPEMWPPHTGINEWTFRRPRQRTASST
jgi:hypothetical protein